MSKESFIKSVVDATNIKIVRLAGGRGLRFGFTRKVGDTLERSSGTYATNAQAYAAAHNHYGLRKG